MIGVLKLQDGPSLGNDNLPSLGDEAARVRLAANSTTPAEVLRQLADDPEVMVRAAVAMNGGAAPEVDRLLTVDEDERVRALLANRVARLLPSLSNAERGAAALHVRSTLATLVEDEAVRVRVAIAEAVKSMPEAPRELVLRLARDHALPVSDPVIRLSPMLNDADLLALLATPPHPLCAASVAERPGLSSDVADAVTAHADGPAIRALLANRSACIQEATLDLLVGRAATHTDWHEPLVRRPRLSPNATVALSGIVATQLLELLLRRTDLDPAVMAELRNRVAATNIPVRPRVAADSEDAVLASVRRLNAANALDEAALLEAARNGDHRRTAIVVAVASGVALTAVDRVAALRNAKALVSLVWRAGFTMRAATVVQAMLGQLGPGTMLMPGPGGGFPLTAQEMEWQIEVLGQAGR